MYSGHWGPPDPGDFAGGGPHGSKQGSVALIPSQGEKWGKVCGAGESVSSHCMEGMTVPRTRGGIG